MAPDLTFYSKAIARIFFIGVALGYPILVYYGLGVWDVRVIATLLLVIMVVRSALMPNTKIIQKSGFLVGACVIAALVFLYNDPLYLKLYPVMMSALMFCIFAMSLVTPPNVIETFARLHFKKQNLPAHVVIYTRNVTKIWCGFFIINGLVAAFTVMQSMKVWALYNGLISYLLMGCLFVGEFLFRQFILKKRGDDA